MGLVVGLIIPIKIYSLALSLPSLVFMALCWRMPESPTRQGSARPVPRIAGKRKLVPMQSMQREVRPRPATKMSRGSKRARIRGETRIPRVMVAWIQSSSGKLKR